MPSPPVPVAPAVGVPVHWERWYIGPQPLLEVLDALPAGPRLAAELADLDVELLEERDCITYAQAVQRQQAWTDSLLVRATARFAEHHTEAAPHALPGRECAIRPGGAESPTIGSFAPAAWGAALKVSTWTARRLIADSLDLVHRLPGVTMSLRCGMTDIRRARMVADGTRDLSADTTGLVQRELLPILARLTPSQLRSVIDRVTATAEPDALVERARQVRAFREVWIDATRDDHAEISGTLDHGDAVRLDNRLDEIARLLGIVQRAGVRGWGPAPDTDAIPGARSVRETWQQRRARALGLLADPPTRRPADARRPARRISGAHPSRRRARCRRLHQCRRRPGDGPVRPPASRRGRRPRRARRRVTADAARLARHQRERQHQAGDRPASDPAH